MLTIIPEVLSKAEIKQFNDSLAKAEWDNGSGTAGSISALVKSNEQLSASKEPATTLANHVLKILGRHPLFLSAALPEQIYPPVFNRYTNGGHYGVHVDSAIMHLPNGRDILRSDLSATLFLTEPADYEGGELEIESSFGAQSVKLKAGDMVLYPSSSLHQVTPVTKGSRVAMILWLQSMVRDVSARENLFELDQSIQELTKILGPESEQVVRLSGVYHNLMRRWAEV